MSRNGILDTRNAYKVHKYDLADIGKRPNKGYLSIVLNNNDSEVWSWHVEAHGWCTSKWKNSFRQREVSVTCSWPTERQRLIDKGEIVGYTYVSEVPYWVTMTRISS